MGLHSIPFGSSLPFRGNGTPIQEKRHFYNMTKTEVAKILDIQPIMIDHYENGDVTIPSATLLKMCEIFQCEVKDLLQN